MIFAIDPGPHQSAWCEFDGTTICAGISNNEDLVKEMSDYSSTPIAIEMIASFGMPVGREVFETCVWIGRFIEASKNPNPKLIYRKDVKMHLCQSMKANDSTIRQALIDRFGKPGTKNNKGLTYGIAADMWSALAIAVTYYDNWMDHHD